MLALPYAEGTDHTARHQYALQRAQCWLLLLLLPRQAIPGRSGRCSVFPRSPIESAASGCHATIGTHERCTYLPYPAPNTRHQSVIEPGGAAEDIHLPSSSFSVSVSPTHTFSLPLSSSSNISRNYIWMTLSCLGSPPPKALEEPPARR